ncbi:MAG: deoxyribose-phosphate aldolase [Tannerella sp.]|jgi:deoxyribose-phosphate aldolase|nr:deoxyribose-phosphate aldolase [Tannerella sp.]
MKNYEYEASPSHTQINKYLETFNRFSLLPPDTEISSIVESILEMHFKENFTAEILKFIHGCIDLTTLTSLDTKDSVWEMVDKMVNNYEGKRPDVPNIAAVCVYPLLVETVKQALTAQDVNIASVVGGFPSSQTFTEIKIAETMMTIMTGAQEIDVVMNLGYFMEEDYEALTDELSEIKDCCHDVTMKVILETGALAVAENIRKATILAAYSGADFVKTSTGKEYSGATFEAVYVMCKVVKEYATISGRKVGIKISGGVRTAEDAVRYYTIVKEVLGRGWLNKELFRIGASHLVSDIEKRLGE